MTTWQAFLAGRMTPSALRLGSGLVHGSVAVYLKAEAGGAVVHLDDIILAAEGFQDAGASASLSAELMLGVSAPPFLWL